jgi:hypothetical protein
VPVNRDLLHSEEEVSTFLAHGLKDLTLAEGIQVLVIAAADRLGLQLQHMRVTDLRCSSALQHETDLGIMLNNKCGVVSRVRLIYNLGDAGSYRSWVVMSVNENRASRQAIDMEFALDAAHPHIDDFVHERRIDCKAVLT